MTNTESKSGEFVTDPRSGWTVSVAVVLLAGLAVAAWWGARSLPTAGSPDVPKTSQAGISDLTPQRPTAADEPGNATAAAEEVVWQTNYAKAFAESVETKRPVLIDFAASWCVPCRLMDKHTWSDAEVQQVLSEDIIPLKVDMDTTEVHPLVDRFEVEFVPTVLLVDPDGKIIFRAGFVDAPQLLELLQQSRVEQAADKHT